MKWLKLGSPRLAGTLTTPLASANTSRQGDTLACLWQNSRNQLAIASFECLIFQRDLFRTKALILA